MPGERFVIKALKEELHAEALTLLREELRETRKLNHPNIVDAHSVNVDGQRLYVFSRRLLRRKWRTCRTSSTDHRDIAR